MDLISVESRNQLISLISKNNEITVYLSSLDEIEFLEIVNQNKEIDYKRINFKTWQISKKSKKEASIKAFILRLAVLLIALIPLVKYLLGLVLNNWKQLESYFLATPLLAGIIVTVLAGIFAILRKRIRGFFLQFHLMYFKDES